MMKSKSQASASAGNSKPSLEVLIDSLLKEATEDFEETPKLTWEWEHYLRLSGLIQKIKEREAVRDSLDKQDNVDDSTRRASELPEFIQWLRRNEADFDKITVGPVDGDCGFGLKTNVPLKSGELVFSVPKSIVLSAEKARNSKLSILVDKDPILYNMQNVLLAMFLLYEKYVNPESFWKPYIRIMPSTFDTIAYYSEEEMALLKVSPRAFRESLRMYRHISRQYAYFHTKFKNSTNMTASKGLKKIFTYKRYTWAVSAVSTRVNNWPKREDFLCMVPVLDLCNHGEGEVISTDYNDESESFLCYAGHDFAKNTEFKMFYGHRSSIDFLIHNGFVPINYRDDIYFLDLSLGANTANSVRKLALLKEMKMDTRMTFPLSPERLNGAKKLFAFINIFIANEEKLTTFEQSDDVTAILEQPNAECLQYLHDRLELMKRVSDTSIASALKTLCANLKVDDSHNSTKPEESHSKVSGNILQLLRNELKLLEMLTHCCKELKTSMQNGTLPDSESKKYDDARNEEKS